MKKNKSEEKLRKNTIVLFLLAILLISAMVLPQRTLAQDGDEPITPDDVCLSCHSTENMQYELPSGDNLYLSIDYEEYQSTEHGQIGYQCVQCHTEISGYPHPEIQVETRREYALEMYDLCGDCHETMYNQTLDSTHQNALAGGNENAAICTDCHNPHYMTTPDTPRSNTPAMCQQCHSEIYGQYQESVHGGALINEGDLNVPTCIDCHGVHDTSGPSSSGNFHLFSPLLCAECHADDELMTQYGISTDVFETYISDFHGKTVLLFEQTAPDQETNKPVCVDCHGVHDMKKVDDPESKVMKENLLETCQRCHPDATSNFPTSWLNHYQPTVDRHPLVYYVNLFYKIIIPVTIGGMIIFISSDVRKKIATRMEKQDE